MSAAARVSALGTIVQNTMCEQGESHTQRMMRAPMGFPLRGHCSELDFLDAPIEWGIENKEKQKIDCVVRNGHAFIGESFAVASCAASRAQ